MKWVAQSLAKDIVVGVADMAVSNDQTATLVTYSLGSCLGVTIYDATKHVAGLLHLMLPDSSIDASKAQNAPLMFVDTGVPLLFRTAYQFGADKSRLVVKVAGGAQVFNDNGVFNIGGRNFQALCDILQKNGVRISAQEVAGQISRTIRLEIATGNLTIKSPGMQDRVL